MHHVFHRCLTPSLAALAAQVTSPRLLGVLPALGPADGGSRVRVSGLQMGFGSQYLCRFGEAVVDASFDAPTGNVYCDSPAHASGSVSLALSFNGRHYGRPAKCNHHVTTV